MVDDGLTDLQKLREHGRLGRPAAAAPARLGVKAAAFARLLRAGDARQAAAVGRLLAQEHGEVDVVAALDAVLQESSAAGPTGGDAEEAEAQDRRLAEYQRTCWEVVDALVSCVDEGVYVEVLQGRVAGWMAAHAAAAPAELLGGCLVRWWGVFAVDTMRKCCEAAPAGRGITIPPQPTDGEAAELGKRIAKDAKKRKRRDESYYLETAERAAEAGDNRTALRRLAEYEAVQGEAALEEAFFAMRCEVYLDVRRYADALADATTVAERFNALEGRELQGQVYRAMGDLHAAMLCFKECGEGADGADPAKSPGKKEASEAAARARAGKLVQLVNLEMLAKEDPQAALAPLRAAAAEAYLAGDYRHAALCYSLLIALEPGAAAAHHSSRAAAHIKTKRYAEALADAECVLQQKPDWGKGQLRRAKALMGLRRPAEAQAALEAGLALQPWCPSMQALLPKAVAAAKVDKKPRHSKGGR